MADEAPAVVRRPVRSYVLRQGQVVREGPSAELVNSGLIAALSSAYL